MLNTSRSLKTFLALAVGAALYSGVAMAQMDKSDASMLQDIAHANIAEIETGKLAVGKSKNPEVKKFAQMMVNDHTQGLADVKKLATEKNVTLPKSPDAMHKAAALQLKALRGGMFDSRYVKQAGVGDHEATEKLLQKTQAEAKDAGLKALATKMLPVVQAHLGHAKELAAAQK
jgi:putative membrane protein